MITQIVNCAEHKFDADGICIRCEFESNPVSKPRYTWVPERTITEKQNEMWLLNERDIARKFVELEESLKEARAWLGPGSAAANGAKRETLGEVRAMIDAALAAPSGVKP